LEEKISDLNSLLKESEKQIDEQLKNLSIWGNTFQAVYLSLLYNAEIFDKSGSGDSAMDYFGRTAELYKLLVKNTVPSDMPGSWASMSTVNDREQFADDVQALYVYSHFCMIMPQIHREVFSVSEVDGKSFKLDYRKEKTKEAETKDKLLSVLSQQMAIQFPDTQVLRRYLVEKVRMKDFEVGDKDYLWIKSMYVHHYRTMCRVQILTDEVLELHLHFSNNDYRHFTAVIVAFSDFFIELGRSCRDAVDEQNLAEADTLVQQHIEWTACSLEYGVLDNMRIICGLQEERFNTLLSYYSQIYGVAQDPKYVSRAMCADGFLPPFVLTGSSVMFSPLAVRHLHPFSNLLYSVSKRQQSLFDNQISKHLEPVLINQTDRLFSSFNGIQTKANENYPGGEIDYMVLSESENVCICFQVKATLTPSSSRTLERVEGRSMEGCDQIDRFESLPVDVRDKIINNAFGTALNDVKILSVLLVRSSAGSEKIWGTGKSIVNYNVLTGMLSNKKSKGDNSFAYFDKEIDEYLAEMLVIANPVVNSEKFDIQDVSIEFPDISMNDLDARARNGVHCMGFPDFEKAI